MQTSLLLILIAIFTTTFSYAKSKKNNLRNPFVPLTSSQINDEKITSSKHQKKTTSEKSFSLAQLEIVKLKYANASDLTKALGGFSQTISYDERTNSIFFQDTPEKSQKLKQLIQQLDQPITQIAIEARIVTISNESLDELGVRWGIFEPTPNTHKISGSLEANGFNNLANQLNVNFSNDNKITASLALQVAKLHGRLLDLELRALEQENSVEIIASPHLLTTNNRSASIKQGTELPYLITNGKNDSYKIEFREAVLGLEVTPHLLHQNTILLDLTVSQNSPGRPILGTQGLVSIDKQEIKSQIASKDGETIVLGGILQNIVNNSVNKVPLLGDIPLLGLLFQNKINHHRRRELVIFITPHIIHSADESFNHYKKHTNQQKIERKSKEK